MARTRYDSSLKEIQMDVVRLSYYCEDLVRRVTKAMCRRDHLAAQKVLDEENQINDMRLQIEERLIRLIATQSPIAADLRMVFATSRIVTDLKRISDYAIEIAKCTLRLRDEEVIAPASDLQKMCSTAVEMINNAVTAYTQRNVELAQTVAGTDDTLDVLYETIYRQMTMFSDQKTVSLKNAVDIMLVARSLENIGDHASSICEWVVFYVTGTYNTMT